MAGLVWSFALAGIGIVGLWLAGSGRWYGWAIGVAAQVAWIAYAVVTGQWGFIVSSLGYGFVYSRNLLRLARPSCAHSSIAGIFGDEINRLGGVRLLCRDCGAYLEGPVSLANEK